KPTSPTKPRLLRCFHALGGGPAGAGPGRPSPQGKAWHASFQPAGAAQSHWKPIEPGRQATHAPVSDDLPQRCYQYTSVQCWVKVTAFCGATSRGFHCPSPGHAADPAIIGSTATGHDY